FGEAISAEARAFEGGGMTSVRLASFRALSSGPLRLPNTTYSTHSITMVWIEPIKTIVIDSRYFETRDADGKPLHTFPHPAPESVSSALNQTGRLSLLA